MGSHSHWELVWADEFDQDGLPDRTRWNYEEGFLRNEERQCYVVERPENARIEGGRLVIEAHREGDRVTSASLTTRGIAAWTYGRFEVRAKVPTGRGTWPAIWMLGQSIRETGWPRCGEIDIMENVGFDPETLHFSVHTSGYNHTNGKHRTHVFTVPNAWADFHDYAIEWFPDRIDFFFDGEKRWTVVNDGSGEASWPFDRPHFLIINLAIGGTWGGKEGVDEAIFPARYEIEHVRVYRRKL